MEVNASDAARAGAGLGRAMEAGPFGIECAEGVRGEVATGW